MTCKDCLKKELGYCKFDCTEPQRCEDFKDKSEWVHLPCKVGVDVYILCHNKRKYNLCIVKGKLYHVWVNEFGTAYSISTPRDDFVFRDNDFGKVLFLTKEEAKKALAKGVKNENRNLQVCQV